MVLLRHPILEGTGLSRTGRSFLKAPHEGRSDAQNETCIGVFQ